MKVFKKAYKLVNENFQVETKLSEQLSAGREVDTISWKKKAFLEKDHPVNKNKALLENQKATAKNNRASLRNKKALLENKRAIPGNKRTLLKYLENKGAILGN